jgi:hypothetical protein
MILLIFGNSNNLILAPVEEIHFLIRSECYMLRSIKFKAIFKSIDYIIILDYY